MNKTIITKILYRIEKVIKTDVSYLAKEGFWLSLNQFTGIVCGFFLSVVFANFLPKEVYGTYKYILTVAATIGSLSLTGMNTAVTRAVARGYDGNVKKSFFYQLKWNSVFITSSAILASLYYVFNKDYSLAASLFVIGILLPIINASNTFSAYLSGKKLFKKIFFYNLFLNLTNIACVVVVILLSNKVFFIIFVYYGIQAFNYSYLFFKSLRDVKPNEEYEQSMESYGRHLSIINIMTTISQNVDKLLAFHLLGALPLAVYNFSTAIPAQIGGVAKIISSISYPKISESHSKNKKINYKRKTLQIMFLFSLLSLLYILIAPYIYKIFFPQYLESIFYSQLGSLIFITTAPNLFLVGILQSAANKKRLTHLNIFTSSVQTISMVLGILSYGLLGLIIAHIVSSTINFFFTYYNVYAQETAE